MPGVTDFELRSRASSQARRIGLALGAAVASIALPLPALAGDADEIPPPAPPPAPANEAPAPKETEAKPEETPPPAAKSVPAAPAECPPIADKGPPPTPIHWRDEWPRVSLWEHALAAVAGAGAFAAIHLGPGDTGRWQNGFDEGVRNALRVQSADARKALSLSSDVIFYGLMLYPIVVDTLLIAGAREAETAWQMTVMNLQSIAIAGATSIVLLRTTGRERPFVRECAADPDYDVDCANPDQHNVSFTSGHTLMSFAGAGLTCVHHLHLPLYGGGLPDSLACAAAIGLAHAEGFLRVSVDVHYATDAIAGGAIGFGIGYLLPRLLHYRGSGSAPVSVSFAPYGEAGLAVIGAF